MHSRQITLPLEDRSEYAIPDDLMLELHENYFGVDQELRRMRMWLIANPTKRKTKRGIKRFIVGWLNRAKLLRPQGRPLSLVRVPEAKPMTPQQRDAGLARLANLKAMIKRA